jgi:hypothetical protein
VTIDGCGCAHEHHAAPLALITEGDAASIAISAHSYAETYATLTRRGDRAPFRFRADEAWAALESLRAITRLVGLTAPQTFDVVRAFAGADRVGPRSHMTYHASSPGTRDTCAHCSRVSMS